MKDSKIEWTDNTANFWWGCMKVSPGCQHCYADTLARRYGKRIWGPAKTTDREQKKEIWQNVLKWDKEAREAGVRKRMFVMSMGDFLEDHPQVVEWRNRAIDLLYHLTNTDVQLLTKRPENAHRFLPESWFEGYWPAHIWIGTSVEDQEQADIRIPELLKIPAKVRFLSCEPLLGPIDLTDVRPGIGTKDEYSVNVLLNEQTLFNRPWDLPSNNRVDWVICGGESGSNARPMNPVWAREIRDQCRAGGVPFFMKQMGGERDKQGHWNQLPEDLRIREFPKGV